ncbi:hypothetical protein D3C81_1911100 [compost metagenome]
MGNGQISVKEAAKAEVADGATGAALRATTAVAAESVKEIAKRALSPQDRCRQLQLERRYLANCCPPQMNAQGRFQVFRRSRFWPIVAPRE